MLDVWIVFILVNLCDQWKTMDIHAHKRLSLARISSLNQTFICKKFLSREFEQDLILQLKRSGLILVLHPKANLQWR